MAKEIERKFLIDLDALGDLPKGIRIKQAYIATEDKSVVRVRLADQDAYLTLKGENTGMSRSEFEYKIPSDEAEQIMSELCSGPSVDKTRYNIELAEHTWEVDIFHGDNEGLIVAEVELTSETETVELPHWVKEEVTGQEKYYNSNLLANPYSCW